MYHIAVSWHLNFVSCNLLNIYTSNEMSAVQFNPICSDIFNLGPNRIPRLSVVSLLPSFKIECSAPHMKADCILQLGSHDTGKMLSVVCREI
jgi:hypothetical protein